MADEQIERQFQVPNPARLNVHNFRGQVEIRPSEDHILRVTAIMHTQTGDPKRTEIELSQDKDGTVQVITRFPNKGFDWVINQSPCSVDYLIFSPQACAINIKSVSSDVSLGGFLGEMAIQTVSGKININNITGTLWVKAVSGDVHLKEINGTININSISGDIKGRSLKGPAKLDTASGKVELLESNLTSVQANTTSGDMQITTDLGGGPYTFHSVSGDVRLVLPANTGCSAELNSISGRIKTELPESNSSRQQGIQHVEIMGGGVKVSLKTISGTLFLTS